MAKYSFSFDDERVTIVNEATQKVDDKVSLVAHVELSEAFRTLTRGRQADAKASDVAISMLMDCLTHDHLTEYKGKTPANEKVPSVFLSALRDIETDVYKPAFIKAHTDKGATGSKADALWQQFRKEELTTGSYSNAKSFVAKLFCHVGTLPVAPNGKLLPLYAVRRMYETWAAAQERAAGPKTIADKLVSLSCDIENRTEKTDIGDAVTAIAALKSMLATYEAIHREALEALTAVATGPTVTQMTGDAIRVAMAQHGVTEEQVQQAAAFLDDGVSEEETPLTGDALTQALRDAEDALI